MTCISLLPAYITAPTDGNQKYRTEYHRNLLQGLIMNGIAHIRWVTRQNQRSDDWQTGRRGYIQDFI
jgi:hypothetical protein